MTSRRKTWMLAAALMMTAAALLFPVSSQAWDPICYEALHETCYYTTGGCTTYACGGGTQCWGDTSGEFLGCSYEHTWCCV